MVSLTEVAAELAETAEGHTRFRSLRHDLEIQGVGQVDDGSQDWNRPGCQCRAWR